MTTAVLPLTPELARRLSGTPLLLLLDIDGTLSPIAPRPEYAVVPPETQAVLRELVRAPHTHVALVSGRSATDARRLAGVDGVWVIGNHGIEVAAPGAEPAARRDVAAYADSVALSASRCSALAGRFSGVIVEDKHWTVSVHYRLAHPQVVPELTAEIESVAKRAGLRVTRGKEVLELRPPVAIDKGIASVELARTLGALGDQASILFAGDDRTDEDAFRELRATQPRAVTVRVAAEVVETEAEFCVNDTDDVRELLRAVLSLHSPGATR